MNRKKSPQENSYKSIKSPQNKNFSKVLDFTKNNIFKILLASGVLVYSGVKISNHVRDSDENEKEKKEWASKIDKREIEHLSFEDQEQYNFWNKGNFFDTDFDDYFRKGNTIEKVSDNIILKHDAGLTFYLMLPEDAKDSRVETINHIRNKLSTIEEFGYLKDDSYIPTSNVVTNTFNIRPDYKELANNSSLNKTPFWIPIPIEKGIRQIDNNVFLESAYDAISLISSYNENYGNIRKEVLEEYSKDELSLLLTAIALIETGNTTGTIGDDTYHRWEEGKHKCFSFGPHHVLMKDGGLKSRFNLGLTEGQIYHPTNSNMLVLGFIIEKLKEQSKSDNKIINDIKDMLKFIKESNLTSDNESLARFCRFYNGGGYKANDYDNKMIMALKLVKISENYKTNIGNFTFANIDSKGENLIYSYSVIGNIEKTSDIIKKFKKTYKTKSKQIQVTRRNGNKYSDDCVFQTGDIVYIKFHTSDAK